MTDIEGWKLVPKDATKEMLSAALMAWLDYEPPKNCEWDDGGNKAIYQAMLAAAPFPLPSADLTATILDWPPDAQFELATKLAASVGYVLAPEPEIDPAVPAGLVKEEVDAARKAWRTSWYGNPSVDDALIAALRAAAAVRTTPTPTSVSEEEMVKVAMDAALEFQNNAPARATISTARHSDVRGLVRSAVSAIVALLNQQPKREGGK